jgi:hypothetical protein
VHPVRAVRLLFGDVGVVVIDDLAVIILHGDGPTTSVTGVRLPVSHANVMLACAPPLPSVPLSPHKPPPPPTNIDITSERAEITPHDIQ